MELSGDQRLLDELHDLAPTAPPAAAMGVLTSTTAAAATPTTTPTPSIFTEAVSAILSADRRNDSSAAAIAALSPSVVSSYAYDVYAPDATLYWNDGGGGGGGELSLATIPGIGGGGIGGVGGFYNNNGNSNNSSLAAADSAGEGGCQSFDENTNLTYWNLTCDAMEYVVPLYGYGMPFLTVITIIANSLIVLVLSKKNMATPTNFVLMVMAVCDMLTVIFPAPGLFYMYTLGNHYKPLNPMFLCQAFNIFNEIMPAICHTASIWLTLALAVQRYIYVCHAPMARTWCTMPRVKRCTLYIAIAAILHQSTRFCDRAYYELHIEWNGQWAEVYHISTAAWVHEYIGEDLYFTCFYGFRVLFVHLLPCIILVTLNILLFRAMRQAQERRKLLFRENRKKECKKLRDSNCTTLMLIVVVTVFLIVEIPIAVMTALHIFSSLIVSFLDYRFANIFITFTNFLLVVSYPINFGIYCGMSRQFRETFKEIFLGRLIRKKDHSSKYSIVNGPRTACTNTNETVL